MPGGGLGTAGGCSDQEDRLDVGQEGSQDTLGPVADFHVSGMTPTLDFTSTLQILLFKPGREASSGKGSSEL